MTFCSTTSVPPPYTSVSLFDRLQLAHPYPLSAMVVLTERCNLSCPHCYVPKPKYIGELDKREISTVFQQLADMGILRLILTGGEPTLRPDLIDIVEDAIHKRFALVLKTNATRLTIKSVEALYEVGLTEIDTSLYHIEPEAHDKFVHENGAFQNTVRMMEHFSALGGRIRVSIIVMKWNLPIVLDLISYIEKKGWSRSVDLRIGVKTDGDKSPITQRANVKQLLQLVSNQAFFDPDIYRDKTTPPMDKPACDAGRGTLSVMPTGEVWPCVSLPWSLGNIREKSLKEIWDTSLIRQKLLSMRRGDAVPCRECPDSPYCARCIANSFLEHGDPNKPAELDCEMARIWATARKNWASEF